MKEQLKGLGEHYIAEFHGCDSRVIDDTGLIEAAMREAVALAGVREVRSFFHRFSPHGISGVIIIMESHITIHCWPEHGYAAVDFFSCGGADAVSALRHLGDCIGASERTISCVTRGVQSGDGGQPFRVIEHEEIDS